MSGSHPVVGGGWSDASRYRQFLDSSGNALTVICCFTDVPANGGGTSLCEDGIKCRSLTYTPFRLLFTDNDPALVERFYANPQGLDPPFANIYSHCKTASSFAEVVAKAGDVLVTHGMLPHSHSPNHLHYARVITNPHVNLSEPFNLNRPDGDYTLCEQVILRNLGRDSVPEYKPTRERLAFYPRTAFFKREMVKDELQRMVAHAEAQGLPASSVDSVYLKGEEAIREHERRNGYDKAWGPTGVAVTMRDDAVNYMPEQKKHVLV